MAKRDVKNAIKSYESAVDRGQKEQSVWRDLENAYRAKGDITVATNTCERAIEGISPRDGLGIISGQDTLMKGTWTKSSNYMGERFSGTRRMDRRGRASVMGTS
jgi:tetratricopeptide (TPR) repeat protein